MITARREKPDPALFAGRGKVEEIAALRTATQCRPRHLRSRAVRRAAAQSRARARLPRRRSHGLILDIFAQRAQSAEGKLQVELAQLEHLSTRLVRGWTHLERQRGGIGLRGPGETQLETDRRLIGERVKLLRDRIAQVGRRRETQRRARRRAAVRNVALVGYTNAGKSTLFNRLTGAEQPTPPTSCSRRSTRRCAACSSPGAETMVVSDTVGFIRDLPHDLVAAFRATLKEAVDADLLLHVIDASHPGREQQIAAVDAVLAEIGADERPADPGVEQERRGRDRTPGSSATNMVKLPLFV